MFVVRLETDQATVFRTFWRGQAARNWALAQGLGDGETRADLYRIAGVRDAMAAVKAVRDGQAKLLVTGEMLLLQNFRERSCCLAGMGIGTGAGF